MANFNLDRIRFRWKSDWVISTDYVKDDIVRYQGKSYVCLIGHQSGPSTIDAELLADTPKWELMFDGNQWRSDWAADTLYYLGDIIKYNGYLYQCVTAHQSTTIVSQGPIDDIEKWTIVATTYNWLNTWTASVANADPLLAVPQYYNLGDVVTYNGITYICTEKHTAASTLYLGLEFDQDKWKIVTRSDNWRTNWTADTRYMVDDIVKYGAITYRCIEGHRSNDDVANGLEDDQAKWEIFLEGIEYKGDWATTFRYKRFDVVKSGGALWRSLTGHTSSTSLREDLVNWEVYVPGLEYEAIWDSSVEYNLGDIVLYGGYTYTALTNNTNSIPSVNGLLQDTGDWELLVAGYKHSGDWAAVTAYKTGDVIRDQGYLYIAIGDSTNIKPDTDTAKWQILVTGRKWKNTWIDDTEYHLGDVVTYAGTTYICISRHLGTESDNRPDLDIQNTNENYWTVLIQGTSSNVLAYRGDLRTHDDTETVRFSIGLPGNIIKSIDGNIVWENFEEVPNVFYVSPSGSDVEGSGLTLNAPFKTVKYACQYVAENFDNDVVNTTIFIKTGIYEEELPIKVPRNCALVGDELRSTVITPESGSIARNMFYVNNGSGIRNMTLQGLTGVLGTPNQYLTRRPTAGAFVSLDPGTGPDDETVWITNKSCYVQNVTTFGTACIGMKIDGALHNGGNRSVVANDFTQVLDDGIGYWALNGGRSELVSVFTYFCHVGYLAEDGGILRATNGNNSYGTYGSVAEGFNINETPITATIDNRTKEAQVNIAHTNGTELVAFGYDHAGQSYTSASSSISGSGINASVAYEEYRDKALAQIRMIDPSDSSTPGGLNYQYLLNNAQGGDATSITLAASDDTGTPEKYIGMRIVIVSGKGVGQYGYITGYNDLTKVAIISKEYNDTNGWENLYPGRPIAETLDGTTRYSLEPRVIIDDPGWSVSEPNITWPSNFLGAYLGGLYDIQYVDGTYIALNLAGDSAISTDGLIFTSGAQPGGNGDYVGGYRRSASSDTKAYFIHDSQDELKIYTPSTNTWATVSLPVQGGSYESIAVNPTNDTVIVYNANDGWVRIPAAGSPITNASFTFDFITNPRRTVSVGVAYGNGRFVYAHGNGNVAYSTDDGSNWTEVTGAIDLTVDWQAISYGNGRFVVVGYDEDLNARATYSFDGITWYDDDTNLGIMPDGQLSHLIYQNGQFLAIQLTGSGTKTVAKSKDGWAWQWFDEDSTVYSVAGDSLFKPAGPDLWNNITGSNTIRKYSTGAGAVARAVVASSRIESFIMYDPGSNYTSLPGVLVSDPENTIDALNTPRIFDGVLPQPVFTNRGEGYVTATAEVTGDGFADIYQTGKTIAFKDVSFIPGPGANIVINGIDDVTYRLTKIVSQSGAAPNHTLVANISPTIKNENSPEHGETLIIREQYSQVRLTGHDFLDIGVGNVNSTRYPELYTEGEDPNTPRQPFNETVDNGGGRVFYTSTDQDGNFRVGELFQVEQASGTVTINADLFELDGLSELSLGGIQVGGSAVVIREFSKDATFVANSNNIVPTQAAILKYLESRISSGGADALTNALIAGQVRISATNITTTSGLQINIPVSVHQTGGIGGDMLAHQLFGI